MIMKRPPERDASAQTRRTVHSLVILTGGAQKIVGIVEGGEYEGNVIMVVLKVIKKLSIV